MAHLRIAQAQRKDLSIVVSLLSEQLAEHSIPVPAQSLARAVEGVFEQPERGGVLLAWVDGLAAGVAYVSCVWAMEHGGRSAWLEELYVRPESRGKGTGEALLREVFRFCAERGCRAVDLEVEADHRRVESLYLRNGFGRLTRSRWVKLLREGF
jgi:GNAT superfamily N-acetyltransferase